MSTTQAILTAPTHRDIPARCTCAWTWRTSARPWYWELTGRKATCLEHGKREVTS